VPVNPGVQQKATPPPTRPASSGGPKVSTTSKTPPPPSGRLGERKEAVNGLFQLAALGCVITGNPADAGAIGKHGDGIAAEVAKLAESNARLGGTLDKLLDAGPLAGVIAAVLPLSFQLMANHGVVKAEFLSGAGVVAPETLAAEVRANQLRMQRDALKAQNDAEREMAQMRHETAEFHAPVPPGSPPPAPNGQGTMGAQQA
jgi:hypothetical protein